MRDCINLILALIIGFALISEAVDSIEPSRIIRASDVVAAINANQSAEFDNCIIEGDLNLIAMNINESIHFNNTTFQGKVNFLSSKLNKEAFFEGSNFNDIAVFRKSIFNNVNFQCVIFNRVVTFTNSKFDHDALFLKSKFNGEEANFREVSFNNDADFRESSFSGVSNFSGAIFNNTAHFSEACFQNITLFSNSLFKQEPRFCGTIFSRTSSFISTHFSEGAYFNEARFDGNVIFDGSTINGVAFFEDAWFNQILSLRYTKYDKMYIRWNNIHSLNYDGSAYLTLLKNFKEIGSTEDYDKCYIQYRIDRRNHPWGMEQWEEQARKQLDNVLYYIYGYGKEPLFPLWWSIGLIILFGVFWSIQSTQDKTIDKYGLAMDQISEQCLQESNKWRKISRIADPFLFSAVVFLSGTKLFIDPPSIPEHLGRSRSLINFIFTLERLLGALFSILFFVTIGDTIIRQ